MYTVDCLQLIQIILSITANDYAHFEILLVVIPSITTKKDMLAYNIPKKISI